MALLRRKNEEYSGDTVDMEAVGLSYDDGPEILSNVSLTIPQRSIHFLTGPSGAGKTSLLSLMYLAKRPTRGGLRLFGEDVTVAKRGRLAAIRRRLGVVFQDFRLLDHMSTFDNVALPLRMQRIDQRIFRNGDTGPDGARQRTITSCAPAAAGGLWRHRGGTGRLHGAWFSQCTGPVT